MASVVTFAYLGYFSRLNNTPINKLPMEDMDLVFITYPAAFATFKGTRLWIFMWFFLLACIGMNGMQSIIENIELILIDMRLHYKEKPVTERQAKFFICIVMMLMGLIFCTRQGFVYLSFINSFVVFFPLAFVSFINYLTFCGLIRSARLLLRHNQAALHAQRRAYAELRLLRAARLRALRLLLRAVRVLVRVPALPGNIRQELRRMGTLPHPGHHIAVSVHLLHLRLALAN